METPAAQGEASAPTTDTIQISRETPHRPNPFSIRAFDRSDYAGVCSINNRFSPYLSMTTRELEFYDRNRDSRCVQQRWVAYCGENLAGYGILSQNSEAYSPTRFQFQIYVLPEFEAKGLEEQLLKYIVDAFQNHRGASLRCLVATDREYLSSILDQAGFKPSMRFWDQRLDFNEVVLPRIERWATQVPHGIEVQSFEHVLFTPDGERKVFELENRLKHDIPFPDDLSMRFDYFQNSVMRNPGLLSDGSFVALDGDRYIGVSYLFQREGNQTAYIRLTGVLPEYRKRGIALHLKALTLRYAFQKGFRSVFTRSEESNQAIKALNDKCGFRSIGSHINWSRAF